MCTLAVEAYQVALALIDVDGRQIRGNPLPI